jgi:hypothetical protein
MKIKKKKSNKSKKKVVNRIFISKVKIGNIKAFKEDNERVHKFS